MIRHGLDPAAMMGFARVPEESMRTATTIALAFAVAAVLGTWPVTAQENDTALMAQVDAKLAAYQTDAARALVAPLADKVAVDPAVAQALGRVLDQEQRFDDAIATLKKAAALAPSDPWSYVWLGETYLHAKKGADADAAFKRAAALAQDTLKTTASDPTALLALGVAQQRLKQYDASAATLTKLLAASPDDATARYQLGLTRAFQARWSDAVSELTRAITVDSGIAYAYYYRGLAADRLGKKDVLVNDMERFVALAPKAPEAAKALAILQAAKR